MQSCALLAEKREREGDVMPTKTKRMYINDGRFVISRLNERRTKDETLRYEIILEDAAEVCHHPNQPRSVDSSSLVVMYLDRIARIVALTGIYLH